MEYEEIEEDEEPEPVHVLQLAITDSHSLSLLVDARGELTRSARSILTHP
jgi:hypothetical protein